jgi:hypothetical protein
LANPFDDHPILIGIRVQSNTTSVRHLAGRLEQQQTLFGCRVGKPPATALEDQMLVVFEGFKTQQRKLESVLTIARLGMASPCVATRFGQNWENFVDHAHRPWGRVGFRRERIAPGASQASAKKASAEIKVRQNDMEQADRSHGDLQQAMGGEG